VSEYARLELQNFRPPRGTALTIGNFDGVHRGHQHLVRFLLERAQASGLAGGAVTLYPDPVRVLRPHEPMQYLTSLEERLELLHGLGLDLVVPLTFTSELAELSPRAFVTLLRHELDMRLLVMGPDNAFGRNREATPERMQEAGAELGFAVEVMPRPLTAGTEAVVSSTSIRAALAEGDLESVARQLGRPYSLRGPVVAGEKRGRTLGFPTANIAVTADRALPAYGVYATWAYLGAEKHQSATSIGIRPHFDGLSPSVETYIFDFDRDIYDQTLRIELVARLRPELKFDSLEALLEEMHRDVARSREILSRTPADGVL
jgi:riboflavin kinase/FMN adenylyltransferase